MAPDESTILPDDTTPPAEEPEHTEAELWEALPDRVPAPFLAGSFEAESVQANLSAVGSVTAEDVQANVSLVGVAKSDWFESIGSVVGAAIVEGDAEVNTSAVPLLIAKGNASLHQAYASAVVAGGEVTVHRGGAPLMVAKKLKVKQGGAAVMIAGEAKVKQGFVGVLISREAKLSGDSRVLVNGAGVAYVSAAVFGGLALVALALFSRAGRGKGFCRRG